MKNKRKWYSVLLIGLILTLAISVVACHPNRDTAPPDTTISPPVVVAFSATPNEISAGESATLLWNVTGATSVSIDQGIGNVPVAGTKEVSPATTITYTLTASNAASTVTESVVITVPNGSPPPKPETVPWDKAKDHIGERTTVSGPVVDTHWASGSNGKPTFLNIGKPYPDPDRFTVVIWIDNRGNFPQAPEVYYLGKTICVTGLIDEYPKGSGSAQIEVKDPSQIQEQ